MKGETPFKSFISAPCPFQPTQEFFICYETTSTLTLRLLFDLLKQSKSRDKKIKYVLYGDVLNDCFWWQVFTSNKVSVIPLCSQSQLLLSHVSTHRISGSDLSVQRDAHWSDLMETCTCCSILRVQPANMRNVQSAKNITEKLLLLALVVNKNCRCCRGT